MSIATALALAPGLSFTARNLKEEQKALRGISTWALQFTPAVSLELPDTVLLEISGSITLFGGLTRIIERVRAGIKDLGFTFKLAAAPTPLAASWLARAGQEVVIDDPQKLKEEIRTLPAWVLRRDAKVSAMLEAIGVKTLGDLLALPRAGLARRFGQELLDQIDRALGNMPDPRVFFSVPEKFLREIELPAPVREAETLLFAAKRLLMELRGFLLARSAAIEHFTLNLIHDKGRKTFFVIGLAGPTRDLTRFITLVREKLNNTTVIQPVTALEVEAGEIHPFPGSDLELFPGGPSQMENLHRLLERLHTRLGSSAVRKLAVNPDHRPEYASVFADSDKTGEKLEIGSRPLWLLESPRAIQEIDSTPHYRGALKLVAGPERLESGWWDGEDIARDYFIAENPEHSLLWIFQDRKTTSWYLHGVFA